MHKLLQETTEKETVCVVEGFAEDDLKLDECDL